MSDNFANVTTKSALRAKYLALLNTFGLGPLSGAETESLQALKAEYERLLAILPAGKVDFPERVEYLGSKETAEILRARLKKEFPGHKFYVRKESYSGGATVHIRWVDGPALDQVERVTDTQSATFDGMTDCAGLRRHWLLPDGTFMMAYQSSAGMTPHIEVERPHPDARYVSFGSSYVQLERAYTKEAAQTVADEVRGEWGIELDIKERVIYLNPSTYVMSTYLEHEDWLTSDKWQRTLNARSFYKPPAVAGNAQDGTAGSVGYESFDGQHTKTGAPLFCVKLVGARLEKAGYQAVAERAKSHGGYYSRFVKGFIFPSAAERQAFLETA